MSALCLAAVYLWSIGALLGTAAFQASCTHDRDVHCYQANKCKVRKRKPQWIPIPKLGLQRVMQGRAGISVPDLPPEGHILTHANGATGIQLAAWGALTSKGASIVPADTVHTRVRGALIDICRKKGTVTVVSAVGPRLLGQVLGETRGKEHKEGGFSLYRGSPAQAIQILHVQLKYASSQGEQALTAHTTTASFFRVERMDALRLMMKTMGE